jgi:hypothetical protein
MEGLDHEAGQGNILGVDCITDGECEWLRNGATELSLRLWLLPIRSLLLHPRSLLLSLLLRTFLLRTFREIRLLWRLSPSLMANCDHGVRIQQDG